MTRKSEPGDYLSAATAAIMAFVMVVSVVAGGAAAATSSTSGDGLHSVQTSTADIAYTYVDGDSNDVLRVVYDDNSNTTYTHTNNIDMLGPVLTMNGTRHVPFADSNGELYVYNESADDATQLATDVATGASSNKGHLGAGEYDGEAVVYYVEDATGSNYIKAANATGAETFVHNESTDAVVGDYDFTNNGSEELVFVGQDSYEIRYANVTAGSVDSSSTSTGQSVGRNNGVGVGAPADFFQNNTSYVPLVTGANNIMLVDHTGDTRKITKSNNQDKAPIAAADIYDNGQYEIVNLEGSSTVSVTTLNGSTSTANIDQTNARAKAGIATGISEPSLFVDDLNVTSTVSPDGAYVNVSFESSDQLESTDLAVEVPSGANSISPAIEDFEMSEDGDTYYYNYSASYEATVDGQYNATLDKATSVTGATTSGLNLADNTTVNTETPLVTIENTTDEYVSDGDNVTVVANVTKAPRDLDRVEFDIGSLGSTQVSADGTGTYEANVTVDGSGVDSSNVSATATVVDVDGFTDSDTASGAVGYDGDAPPVTASGDTTATAGDSVSLSADASDATSGVDSIEWDFGDGGTATGADVSHTYDSAGEYTATVTVTDAAGNENTDTVTVDVSAADDGSDDSSSDDSGSSIPSDVRERDNAEIGSDGVADVPGSDVQRIAFEDAPSGERVVVDRVSDLPEGAADLDEVVSIYRIDVPAEASDSAATIEFSLDESALDGADASAVVVEHYDGEEWTALDTSATVEDGEVTVEAETDGFSTFAVTTSGDATEDTSGSDGASDSDGSSDDTSGSDDTSDSGDDSSTDDSEDTSGSDDTSDSGGDSTDESADGSDEETTATEDDTPGFGAVVAVIALVAAAFVARRR